MLRVCVRCSGELASAGPVNILRDEGSGKQGSDVREAVGYKRERTEPAVKVLRERLDWKQKNPNDRVVRVEHALTAWCCREQLVLPELGGERNRENRRTKVQQ